MFNLKENISLAISGLLSNKMRALLTMLGIIIGIGSVIAIVTVGDSMTRSVTDAFNEIGANNIGLQTTAKADENGNRDWNHKYEQSDMLTDEMMVQYMEAFDGRVEAYCVQNGLGTGQAINGHNQANGQIVGINPEGNGTLNLDIIAGHFISEKENAGAKHVAVISDDFISKLFPGTTAQQALGREVKFRMSTGTYTFIIAGVYRYEVSGMAANMTGDVTTNVIIPLTVADQIANAELDGYNWMQIKASDSVTDSKAFAKETEEYFNKRFFRSNKYTEVRVSSMESMLDQMTTMMGSMKMAISVIAAISLLVGGIGVMNIMLVSVTERTREIGTRKALGAKNGAIRIQFVVESMIICMIGGVIGVLLGTGLGRLGSTMLGAPGWPAPSIVLIAVGFSMVIGVFFGYYPANKAAKLDPIEALRYE